MKISRIFKGIIGIGAVSGIAYTAYKLGEMTGEVNERFNQKYGEDNEDEIRFYDDMDEPDDGCLAPAENVSSDFSTENTVAESEKKSRFAHISEVKVDDISDIMIRHIFIFVGMRKVVSNKMIREYFALSFDKTAEILDAFTDAGYVGRESGNHKIPVYVTFSEYDEILR